MTTAPRVAGHLGRLPAKPPGERFAIAYVSDYTKHGLPAPTYPVDVSHGITDWKMLGNGPDASCTAAPAGVGDCTFAGREHLRMAKAMAGGLPETWRSSDDIVAEYLNYDGGQDIGANIADLLLFWQRTGRIMAFAPVNHTDPAEVDAAMAAFHGIYAGVALTDDAEHLFSLGQEWTTSGGEQPDQGRGHCIVKVGADGQGTDTWVTWGALQRSTTAWTAACLEEAWVIVAQEDAAAVSLDYATLTKDLEALKA